MLLCILLFCSLQNNWVSAEYSILADSKNLGFCRSRCVTLYLVNEVRPTQDLFDLCLALVLPFRIQHEKEDEEAQGVAHGFRTGLEEVNADTHEVFIGEVGVVPHCSQVCINEVLFRNQILQWDVFLW